MTDAQRDRQMLRLDLLRIAAEKLPPSTAFSNLVSYAEGLEQYVTETLEGQGQAERFVGFRPQLVRPGEETGHDHP